MKKGKSIVMSEDDWEARNDLRTLVEARKIRSDQKRLKRAQECARSKIQALRDISEEAHRPAQ